MKRQMRDKNKPSGAGDLQSRRFISYGFVLMIKAAAVGTGFIKDDRHIVHAIDVADKAIDDQSVGGPEHIDDPSDGAAHFLLIRTFVIGKGFRTDVVGDAPAVGCGNGFPIVYRLQGIDHINAHIYQFA